MRQYRPAMRQERPIPAAGGPRGRFQDEAAERRRRSCAAPPTLEQSRNAATPRTKLQKGETGPLIAAPPFANSGASLDAQLTHRSAVQGKYQGAPHQGRNHYARRSTVGESGGAETWETKTTEKLRQLRPTR